MGHSYHVVAEHNIHFIVLESFQVLYGYQQCICIDMQTPLVKRFKEESDCSTAFLSSFSLHLRRRLHHHPERSAAVQQMQQRLLRLSR